LDFQPSGGASPTLDDDTYRFVLKAKIAQNQWDGTIPQLYEIWNNVFPLVPIRIKDNQDMSFDVLFVSPSFTNLEKELITNGYIIPKPQSVLVSYSFNGTFSFRTAPLGAGSYVAETDILAGFSDETQVDGGYFGSVSTS
jgi:hypothetical protein